MRKILTFLSYKLELIFMVLLVLFIFFFAFYLGNLDFQYYYLSLELSLFVFLLALLLSYLSFQKREKILEENIKLKEELEALRADLLSANKELEDYFILWLHQMKTPITAAKLILEKELTTEKEEGLRVQLQYIEQYAEMALNYLKLTNTNTDMDITKVALAPLVKSVIKKYSFLFIKKEIRLELCEMEAFVVSDTKWLSVLLEQLISNALKYTESGFIRLSYDLKKREFRVEDSGIGIRSEDIPKIFDKGYSGFNGRLNQKSSGLGLFLGKKIAERLGIAILVDSEVGKGSRFTLKFLD